MFPQFSVTLDIHHYSILKPRQQAQNWWVQALWKSTAVNSGNWNLRSGCAITSLVGKLKHEQPEQNSNNASNNDDGLIRLQRLIWTCRIPLMTPNCSTGFSVDYHKLCCQCTEVTSHGYNYGIHTIHYACTCTITWCQIHSTTPSHMDLSSVCSM